jgi:hypothetical protein
MSQTLANRSLCDDTANYENLLASLAIVRSVLDCDPSGNFASGVGATILSKLAAEWLDCFTNQDVYYYSKTCELLPCEWLAVKNGCINEAIEILYPLGTAPPLVSACEFKALADGFMSFLGDASNQTLSDVTIVIIAFCNLLVQRVKATRSVRKAGLTINDCDL